MVTTRGGPSPGGRGAWAPGGPVPGRGGGSTGPLPGGWTFPAGSRTGGWRVGSCVGWPNRGGSKLGGAGAAVAGPDGTGAVPIPVPGGKDGVPVAGGMGPRPEPAGGT